MAEGPGIEYFKKKGVPEMIETACQALLEKQPEDVPKFLAAHFSALKTAERTQTLRTTRRNSLPTPKALEERAKKSGNDGNHNAEALKLLQEIDALKEGDKKLKGKAFELFLVLDKDRTMKLEGAEYDQFLKMLGDYVANQVAEDLGFPADDHERETWKAWAKAWIDPDGDGVITMAEMKDNIHIITNQEERDC